MDVTIRSAAPAGCKAAACLAATSSRPTVVAWPMPRARRTPLFLRSRPARSATSSGLIEGVKGEVVIPTDPKYEAARDQYAYSTHACENRMRPAAIIYAKGDDDVRSAIEYANTHNVSIAVRTGGHQYSGASSTYGSNIQLDISETYQDFEFDDKAGIVTMGISRRLTDLNAKLGQLGVFVPHGQCANVHVGGHTHTGGYGLPGRAFGLFGDHIQAVRAFTADGKVRWIDRNTTDPEEADLFWAILGGSPGNFAIVTHIKLNVHRDKDHPKARGMKLFGFYSKEVLEKLLQVKADMAADVNLPRDYDFCITVISIDPTPNNNAKVAAEPVEKMTTAESSPTPQSLLPAVLRKFKVSMEDIASLIQAGTNLDGEMAAAIKRLNTDTALIVVFAEWANTGGQDQSDYDDKWFKRIYDAGVRRVGGINIERWLPIVSKVWGEGEKPMSYLTSQWVFNIKREFLGPYQKRTYATSSTELPTSGWVQFTANQIDEALKVDNWIKGLRLAVQIQNYGGKHSRYTINDPNDANDPRNKTSYSWRKDTTVVQVMDCFIDPHLLKDIDIPPKLLGILSAEIIQGKPVKAIAEEWGQRNDEKLRGPRGTFSPGVDRRLLWGSYYNTPDEFNLSKSHLLYHENEAKWARLESIKRRVDMKNIFTPNDFAVRA